MADIFKPIRTKIIEVINAQATKVQAAYRSEQSSFSGFPAAVVSASENEADYEDTSMRQLDLVFVIRLYCEIPKDGQDKAEVTMDEAVDEMLTIFRNNNSLSPVVDMVTPVPSRWGYTDLPSGQMRMAEIRLKCRKYINT